MKWRRVKSRDVIDIRGASRSLADSFTHGTSEQRRRWFETGYSSGEPASGDSFAVDEP